MTHENGEREKVTGSKEKANIIGKNLKVLRTRRGNNTGEGKPIFSPNLSSTTNFLGTHTQSARKDSYEHLNGRHRTMLLIHKHLSNFCSTALASLNHIIYPLK